MGKKMSIEFKGMSTKLKSINRICRVRVFYRSKRAIEVKEFSKL